ncbi:proline racemase (plasmid) [Gemmatirosa kalamazoonensis]|uniref:Proline racemase n=1 Tax=Gemmatirosa kalamazoonensis TaxID=861299 RepID=W0RPJ7_9BACT|nr:proline racemase family protein [Gemmatirosa kalamazoonensis]AHG92412.1 proline racemase [Gemmatirosa kalamazoonensis]
MPSVERGASSLERIHVVDSHTEGEPTRVVIDGWPLPDGATMAERRDVLRSRFDHLRRGVVREPRGSDAVVGALLTPPVNEGSAAGIVFFNNGTYLGMCGHGLIGVVRTLEHLGRLTVGTHQFDTPVGTVRAELAADGTVTIENVPARLHARDVSVEVPGYGTVTGDVAYGGNWFFITHAHPVAVDVANVRELTRFTQAVQDALDAAGLSRVDGGGAIDHIEISAESEQADCRNFVLCSGGEYDRSPCGTGTSAKLATLHARGELAVGQPWRQEGIAGGVFTGWLAPNDAGEIVPFVRGTAYVTAESTLILDPRDPFRFGIGG